MDVGRPASTGDLVSRSRRASALLRLGLVVKGVPCSPPGTWGLLLALLERHSLADLKPIYWSLESLNLRFHPKLNRGVVPRGVTGPLCWLAGAGW